MTTPTQLSAAELMAQIEQRRSALEAENEKDRAAIEQACERIAKRKAELDALPVARMRRSRKGGEQKAGGK